MGNVKCSCCCSMKAAHLTRTLKNTHDVRIQQKFASSSKTDKISFIFLLDSPLVNIYVKIYIF